MDRLRVDVVGGEGVGVEQPAQLGRRPDQDGHVQAQIGGDPLLDGLGHGRARPEPVKTTFPLCT